MYNVHVHVLYIVHVHHAESKYLSQIKWIPSIPLSLIERHHLDVESPRWLHSSIHRYKVREEVGVHKKSSREYHQLETKMQSQAIHCS